MFQFIGRGVKKASNRAAEWANVRDLKSSYSFYKRIINFIFNKKDQEPKETFEEAVKRLKLTPQELAERKKMFQTQLWVYGLGAIAVAIYTLYLMVNAYWISVLPSFLVMVFLIVCTLKSHFWLFQLKQKKLGCTLHEWFYASIKELK